MINLLHQILDESAQRHADHEAMRFGGRALTYGEWLRQADALAAALVEGGVRRGDRVGIYLNKCLETAIAIYGIWKAGAAYVPLDPAAPVARTAFALNDCAIRHIVTQPGKADAVRALAGLAVLDSAVGLDPADGLPARCLPWREVDTLARAGARANPQAMTEDDLAYVMYTSGSTGTPKGLMHTHASGLSYARLSAETYGISQNDRLGNHSPLHFDMSTFEYFTGPLRGATTVIIPEAVTRLPASMSKLIEDERLTIWYSVTTALVQLLLRGALERRDLSRLRWVNYGGEPFPPRHLGALMRHIPNARFSNVYGPAEVNQCTYYHLPPLDEGHDQAIPIGCVWDGAEGMLLDERDQPVLPGEIGEFVVRTPTMMRGYWGRPDLNARAFLRRPASGHDEAVFYRTGDLMWQDTSGLLHFAGRKDRQIKTRGYRVELDEVESALSLHDAVGECAVFAVPDEVVTNVIEAAVVFRHGQQATEAALQRALSERIPAYAVPARIAFLSDMPRTGTGKIDRSALRDRAAQTRPAAQNPAAAPTITTDEAHP